MADLTCIFYLVYFSILKGEFEKVYSYMYCNILEVMLGLLCAIL